jgi:ParB/RepB/Spo0J family partition protein
METENGIFSNARVLRSDVVVDPDLNSRKTVDLKKIDRLAQSIRVQGVINPPLLIRTGQLGYRYQCKQPYVLIAGFRRQAALDVLAASGGVSAEIQETDYRVAPVDWTIADAITANLTENLAREDLSTFELAKQCVELRDHYDLTAKDIAAKVKGHDSEGGGERKALSESHVNNLMRCVTQLHPDIIAAWKEQHPKASLRFLIKLASIESYEQQCREWRGETAQPAGEEPATRKQRGESEAESEEEEREQGRPTVAVLTMMIEAVKLAVRAEKRDADWAKGAIAALRYAAGLVANLPGVKPAELMDPEEA